MGSRWSPGATEMCEQYRHKAEAYDQALMLKGKNICRIVARS